MKKALFTLLLVAATCSVAMAQNRVIVTIDTAACESFVWNVNGQTYTADTALIQPNAANDTLFVLNLVVAHNASASETVVSDRCDYTWHGETYHTSGTYTDTVAILGGCDSVYTLNLTLDSVEIDSLTVSACGEYVWYGDTLITSGIYTDTTYSTVNNCMNIEVLDLSIVTQLDRYDTVANCGKYIWNNDTLTTSGDYTYFYEDTITLCDTLFHLNFDFTVNDIETVYDSACNAKTWRGNTYNETGVYYVTDTNSTTGCVTRRTLDLKIKQFRTPAKDTTMSGCNSVRFTVSSLAGSTTRVFSESTDFDTNLISRRWEQCYDSTIHLHVIIRRSTSTDTVVAECDSFYWDRTKKIYKADNEVKYTLPDTLNAARCDSSIILKLTIKSSPVIEAINGDWRLAEGETARLYPTATEGSVYRWTVTPSVATSMDGDTLVIPNVQGNLDVALEATINYSDVSIACHDTSWISIITYVGIASANTPSVTLYPNPTVGQLNIECAEAVREVSVFNALGQQVATAENLGTKGLMNLAALSRGTYTMRIVMANGESIVRKFVITK